jgi:hypothetical protein
VGGALRLAGFVAGVFEAALDALVHLRMTALIGRGGNALIELVRADASDLSNNIAYVLAVAALLIAAALWWV